MYRPRSKLQVSTFPFLAVLLCAMGSLLLFLFIMDRRAKIAAQNRAREARETMAARKPDTQNQRDARQIEWEEAREKLRRLLLEQHQQVLSEAQGVQQNLSATGDKLNIVQTRYLDIQLQLASETAKILALQDQIEQQKSGIRSSDKKEAASKSELAKATQELLELTTAFQLLQAQKQREKEVYSLVPYRGKRGDARPPIYIECSREGLLLHPDKKLLSGGDLSPQALINEVERRAGAPLAVVKATKDKGRL